MTLLYSCIDRETHSSKTNRCMTLALSCRNISPLRIQDLTPPYKTEVSL